ncbi:MAG: Na+/H+ antiporter NhaC family protein [Marinilabiliaceae bacterium]|nr:Na+/H+ antiporter NhaC family protein [Marinilabiliaceae bacterium]
MSHSGMKALLPVGVFLVVYLIPGVLTGDFYKMPIVISFLISSLVAVGMAPGRKIGQKMETFTKGMGHGGIMMMCLIFLLAGAFANVAREMGAVESTVNLGLHFLPGKVLLAGLFIIGCFISLSVGTSVGTVVALSPVALGLSETVGFSAALALGAVIGGAMFGDNLSMISDTTIAATRSQNCSMRDKFKMNIWLVLPAAVITFILYLFLNAGSEPQVVELQTSDYVKVIPYLVVLITALLGVNVFVVLLLGITLSGIIGLFNPDFTVWSVFSAAGKGMESMSEIVIVSMLVGGMVEVVRINGGIDYLLRLIGRKTSSRKGAELSIAGITGLVNVFTANNTIAILMAGPIAKTIADQYGISPRRSASIMDTSSCFVQGTLPYGAQILAAVGLAAHAVSPFEIMSYLFYPYLMGVILLLSILVFSRDKR